MEFGLSEEQLAVSETATGLFAGLVDPERVAAVESTHDRIDRDLWQALAAADLLGLAVPAEHGGGGYGLTELCLLLEAQGNAVAPVPLWATLVLGALPLAHFGSAAQQARWLPGVVRGEVLLTAALAASATSPTLSPAVRCGGRRRRAGCSTGRSWWCRRPTWPPGWCCRRAPRAARSCWRWWTRRRPACRWSARSPPTARSTRTCTSTGLRVGPDDLLVGPEAGRSALDFMVTSSTIALGALQVGVCEAALTQTAAYLNGRHQFGRPLSTFQGTMLRAADAAIDIEAMRVTWQNAAWRFDTGRDAADAARVAKWQASERGQRTVAATQHLHGGMGADITYPIHRYFLWGKQIELLLGGASLQLSKLGASIAERALVEASS